MAPTSDERREVAARLRNDGRALDAIDAPLELASLTLDDALGIDHMRSWCDVFERLADLIDPTCEMVVKNGHACCGRCGHRLADECEVEEDYYEFRPICPDCGARVTSGGEG